MQSMMSESPAKQLVLWGRTIENSPRACARILWFERIGMSLSREANFSPGRCCCIPCMVICFLWATSWWIGRHRLSVCLSVYKQLLTQCLRRIGCRIMFSPRSYACCVKHIYIYIYIKTTIPRLKAGIWMSLGSFVYLFYELPHVYV